MNEELDLELKRSEIDAKLAEKNFLHAEIAKSDAEKKLLDLNYTIKSENRNKKDWTEIVKVLGAIVIGLGGLIAAYHQHELAEAKVLLAEMKAKEAESVLIETNRAIDQADRELKDLTESKNKALEEKSKAESEAREARNALEEYKLELSKLDAEVRSQDPATNRDNLVYIQFRGDITRGRINDLRETINTKGFNSPGAERIDGEYSNIVKFFSDSDSSAAKKLAEVTEKYFIDAECPLSIRLVPVDPGDKEATPIEMWLSHACN